MPVVASCQCGAKFAAQDHLAGKTVRCPKCSQPLQIPSANASSPLAQTPAPQPRVKPPAATAPAAPAANVGGILDELGVTAVTGVRCPQCSSDTPPTAVICVKCGYNLQRGRQLKVESDALLAKKRAALDAKKAAAADRNLRKKEAIQNVGSGDAKDLGGVTEAATAIIRFPTESFQRLSTVASTRAAFEFAFVAAFFISLFWVTFFTLYFFSVPLAKMATDPGSTAQVMETMKKELMPMYWVQLRGFVITYAAGTILQFCVVLPAMAGAAHLILKFVGNSKLEYTATLRVLLYTTGASVVLSGLPCIQIFAPISWLVSTAIGFTVHHRVNAGAALLALVVSVIAGIVAGMLIYMFMAAVIAALVAIMMMFRS